MPSGYLPSIRPSVSVDVVLFQLQAGQLETLLIRRSVAPCKGQWAIPGGFVHIKESLEDAARRELAEETGSTGEIYLEQLFTWGDPKRDPRGRVITVAYFALVASGLKIQAGDDAADVQWFPVTHLPLLAFDHSEIMGYALRRLRYKLEYSAVGFQLLPTEFTLGQLQSAYEIVLGESLDKRNFRRRILAADVVEETGRLASGKVGPRAMLYRYQPDAVAEVKARRLFPFTARIRP
jgi:8-oxo-dGTP diphosphatase